MYCGNLRKLVCARFLDIIQL